jgi:hypothetical protein
MLGAPDAISKISDNGIKTEIWAFDGEGVLNFFDVSVYLSAYSAGCP